MRVEPFVARLATVAALVQMDAFVHAEIVFRFETFPAEAADVSLGVLVLFEVHLHGAGVYVTVVAFFAFERLYDFRIFFVDVDYVVDEFFA